MNKEQLKKEFSKWLDNGRPKVWVGYGNGAWDISTEPFMCEDCIYVIDDEMAFFRKAWLDGRRLQWQQADTETWFTFEVEPDWSYFKPEKLRIHPEDVIYEWQWYIFVNEENRYFITEDFFAENELDGNYFKFEPSKRIRK